MTREEIEKEIRKLYPYGHPDFVALALDEVELHSEKNHDYAFGGDPLGNFKRRAAQRSHYTKKDEKPSGEAITDMNKQYDALLWLTSVGHEARVESPAKRLADIGVYAKIISILLSEEETAKQTGVSFDPRCGMVIPSSSLTLHMHRKETEIGEIECLCCCEGDICDECKR